MFKYVLSIEELSNRIGLTIERVDSLDDGDGNVIVFIEGNLLKYILSELEVCDTDLHNLIAGNIVSITTERDIHLYLCDII